MVAWTVDRWQRWDVFNVKNKLMLFLCFNIIVKKCFISHQSDKSNQSHINCYHPPQSNDRMDCEIWPGGEERPATQTVSCVRCTMGIIITSGTMEYAITNHRNKHKHTTPMFRHKPEILDLRPPSSGPGSVSGCRYWLSVKVRSSRRSHLHPSSPSEETNAVWKAWGNLKIEMKLNTLVLL